MGCDRMFFANFTRKYKFRVIVLGSLCNLLYIIYLRYWKSVWKGSISSPMERMSMLRLEAEAIREKY